MSAAASHNARLSHSSWIALNSVT